MHFSLKLAFFKNKFIQAIRILLLNKNKKVYLKFTFYILLRNILYVLFRKNVAVNFLHTQCLLLKHLEPL